MQGKEFHNVKIAGIACAVPNHKVMTESYKERFGEATVDRFKQATGIEGRYISDGTQTASDLCYVAADRLMREKGVTGDDIDALIFLTQTPDYCRPSTAFVLQKRLNIKKDCLVFDVNLGCSAFVSGVYTVAGLIESGTVDKALVMVGDAGTLAEAPEDDTSLNMMFGDAGSAILLSKGEGNIKGMIRSDGEGYKTLITPIPGFRFPGVIKSDDPNLRKRMDGEDTFLFTITKVPKLFKEFFKSFESSVDDYNYVILHQANKMIINQVTKKLKVTDNKVPISLDRYGNTDGPSIPVTIVDLCERLKEGTNLSLITSGFGIGLSWGIISFDINSNDVLPMIFTDDYFVDGKRIKEDAND